MINVVLAKPTRRCPADCSYCNSPPVLTTNWTIEDFKRYFDAVEPYLSDSPNWIWHGGEPMLMGPDFFDEAADYMRYYRPHVCISMQTNILLYDSRRWKETIENSLDSNISTSFDPDEYNRTIQGDPEAYSRQFHDRLKALLGDGFSTLLISTYTEQTAHLAEIMYDWALDQERNGEAGEGTFGIRANYAHPVGRASDGGEMITPATYGNILMRLYNRWIQDQPYFPVVPVSQMLDKTLGHISGMCPWTRSCGGHFLNIDPDGNVHNCAEFADIDHDLAHPKYSMGNLNRDPMEQIVTSEPAIQIRRRRFQVPDECQACPHFDECQGGCTRDAMLHSDDYGGKTYYCQSWYMTFSRIKASLETGEAAGAAAMSRARQSNGNRPLQPEGVVKADSDDVQDDKSQRPTIKMEAD